MFKSRFKSAILASLCILTVSLSACGGANRGNQQPGPGDTTQQGRNMIGDNRGVDPNAGPGGTNLLGGNRDGISGNNPPDNTRIGTDPGNNNNINNNNNNAQYTQQQITDGRGKSDNIKRQLGTIKEIRNPNVVVIGNTALVGFNTANTKVDAAKARDMVINKVKQVDPSVTNVLATDSQDVLPGITRLSEDIRNNRPVNTIGDNFNQIVRGINPAGR
ncbi:MAG: YhcN/YlaJ family sporulation lipoprotein [Clostridia bacterium]|nr:YhcN/YlaJ family sporulation lipoprotein [Clostridia bacterium]